MSAEIFLVILLIIIIVVLALVIPKVWSVNDFKKPDKKTILLSIATILLWLLVRAGFHFFATDNPVVYFSILSAIIVVLVIFLIRQMRAKEGKKDNKAITAMQIMIAVVCTYVVLPLVFRLF